MTRILLTGFEPFGGMTINPSEQVVHQIHAHQKLEAEIIPAILPVSAQAAPKVITDLLSLHQPDWCVMLGLAEGRASISIERVAVNLADFRIPDNSGTQLVNSAIEAYGPAAYFSTLPVHLMQQASLEAGVPTELSLSAGAYLCNLAFYTARHYIEEKQLATKAGFIHLPATPAIAIQSKRSIPSMGLELIITGIEASLQSLLQEAYVTA